MNLAREPSFLPSNKIYQVSLSCAVTTIIMRRQRRGTWRAFSRFLDKFGERPLITEPLGWDPYKSDAYRLLRAANDHTAYVSCTTIAGLEGVVNIDAKATIQAKEGEEAVSFTFRKVLRNLVKYKEGNKEGNLIAEARQTGVGGKVEVVHPDTPAAEKEVEMMNKNVAAYVFHTLLAEGVDEKFLQDLLRRSCLSSLYQDIPN